MRIRTAKSSDFDKVHAVMNRWWGGRQVDHLQQELFFDHFTDTAFIAENDEGELIGFINGFYSQAQPATAYVHFMGVAPKARKCGLGRKLYQKFFDKCICDNRHVIKSCTSLQNTDSITFHKKIGFQILENRRGKAHFMLVLEGLSSPT